MNYVKQIRDFVVANFLFGEAGTMTDDTSFMRSGTIDSTGIMELVVFLETTYNIKLQDAELIPGNLDTVNNVARFLEKKKGEAAGGSPGASSPKQAKRSIQPS